MLGSVNSFAGGGGQNEFSVTSDQPDRMLFGFFDLRERESFIQVTNESGNSRILHVQIFNVDDDCNENNFFDEFTINDTHIYDMRDIITNDGNPSGVVLPDNAYGVIVISSVQGIGQGFRNADLIGNQRILDNNGYEYRTNLVARRGGGGGGGVIPPITLNYSSNTGVTFSDVVGITVSNIGSSSGEVSVDPARDFWAADVDIFNNNEVPFSCRNVIFACIDQDNPRLEELLTRVGEASVASFEYGINDAIPHSRGGELLCPNNVIDEGFVRLSFIRERLQRFVVYVGLNNGNDRGSFDSYWFNNRDLIVPN